MTLALPTRAPFPSEIGTCSTPTISKIGELQTAIPSPCAFLYLESIISNYKKPVLGNRSGITLALVYNVWAAVHNKC